MNNRVVLLIIIILMVGFISVCAMNGYIGESDEKKTENTLNQSAEDDSNEDDIIPIYEEEEELVGQFATASDAEASQPYFPEMEMNYDVATPGDVAAFQVQGEDIYDEDKFQYIRNVPDDYFNHAVFVGESRAYEVGSLNDNQTVFAAEDISLENRLQKTVIQLGDNKYVLDSAIKRTYFNVYYLDFGINDLTKYEPEEFVKEVRGIVDSILKKNPNAIIYYMSIIPVTGTKATNDDNYNRIYVAKYNDAMKAMCKEQKDVIYLDCAASVILSHQYLPDDASSDGILLNKEYAEKVMAYIKEHAMTRKK